MILIYSHTFHYFFLLRKRNQTLKCERNANMNVYISSHWNELNVCRFKNAEILIKEMSKLFKFNNLNYYHPYHAKLSPNLQLPTFWTSSALSLKPLPLSCPSNENALRKLSFFLGICSLTLLPHNLSLNIQGPFMSAPQEFHQALFAITCQ